MALERRGLLTIRFDPEMEWDAAPTDKRGRQQTYSDAAVQTCLTMKVPFGLDWTVPGFSTLSRRHKTLAVNIPYRGSRGPLHLLLDSTGFEDEGEGHARTHGDTKRHVWRKIYLGIDEPTLEVRAIEATGNPIGDAPMLPDLLSQIPPRRNAKPWKATSAAAAARNDALRASKNPGASDLAKLVSMQPPKPRRDEDELHEAAGAAASWRGTSIAKLPRPRTTLPS